MFTSSADGLTRFTALPYAGSGPSWDNEVRPERVLVADNNDATRRHTASVLRDAGYTVYDVPDGGRALVAMRQRLADVAVVDDELPDRSGLDLLREAGRIGTALPVILSTSSYNVDRAVTAMKHGAADYLTKPLTRQRLLDAVAGAVQTLQPRLGTVYAEERGERQRHLQRAAAFGILATAAIHNLSNSLTVSMGLADLLLGSLPLNDPLRKHAAEFAESSKRDHDFLDDLKRLAQKTPAGARDIDLNLLVTRLRPVLEAAVRENINLAVATDPALGYIHADLAQLEQVLINLVLNARAAMPRGGTIYIRTANDDLDQQRGPVPPGAYVVLSVRDTGTGMTGAIKARMYEEYHSTRDPQDGAGLGLSIVADILARAGGHITCDSHIGRGTDFTLYFPRVNATPTVIGTNTVVVEHV